MMHRWFTSAACVATALLLGVVGCKGGSDISDDKHDAQADSAGPGDDATLDASSNGDADSHAGGEDAGGEDAGGGDGSAADASAEADAGEECEHDIPTDSYVCLPCTSELEGAPCGFAPTGGSCTVDGDCDGQEVCWKGGCYERDGAAIGDGCVELSIELHYGGSEPDRVYELNLTVTPVLQDGEGADVVCAADMVADNPRWAAWAPHDCEEVLELDCDFSFYTPVSLRIDEDGFHSSGGSGYTVHKVRGESASLAAAWAGASSLSIEANWTFQFHGDDLDRSSRFIATVWSTSGGCSVRTVYDARVGPGWPEQYSHVTEEPVTTMLCP
jgi:hypothetical protein